MDPEKMGPQFFHATGVEFAPGDIVKPAEDVDKSFGGTDRFSPTFAFAAGSVDDVLTFARDTPHRAGIYEVEPLGEVVTKIHSSGWTEHGTREGWRVKSEVEPPEGGWAKATAEKLRKMR